MDGEETKEDEPQPSCSKRQTQNQDYDNERNVTRNDEDQGSRIDRSSSSGTLIDNHTITCNELVDGVKTRHKRKSGKIVKRVIQKQPRNPKRDKSYNRARKKGRPIKHQGQKGRRRRRRQTSHWTIFTRLSSGSLSMNSSTLGCKFCGHRCCHIRSEYQSQRRRKKTRLRTRTKKTICKRKDKRPKMKTFAYKYKGRCKKPIVVPKTECIQAGSRCLMLSPLCVGTNEPSLETAEDPLLHCGVTPEMIFNSVQKLTMWKEEVSTIAILNYMRHNFPVCQDIPQLCEELEEKLRIASMVDIVTQTVNGNWRLNCDLRNRKLTSNHVTLFWDLYADTMKPVVRKPQPLVPENDDEMQTEPARAVRIVDTNTDEIV